MCIWNTPVADRHCEFCSYRGGCERYPIVAEQYSRALENANRFISVMSEAVGCDIMIPSRKQRLVWARNMVLYMLRLDGFSLMSIEKATGKNHATVIYAERKVKEMLKRPNMYPSETKIWNEFQEKLTLQHKNSAL